MAINFTDFTKIPLQDEVPDLLGRYMRGYKAAQMPAQMREEQRGAQLANALKEFQLKTAPRQFEQESEFNTLRNQFKRGELENQPEQQQMKALLDALTAQQRTMDLEDAPESRRLSNLEKQLKIEEQQRKLASDEDKRQLYGEERPVRFDELSKPEQKDIAKQMRSELYSAYDIEKAGKTLDEMKKIVKEYPNISDSMTNIFMNPDQASSILSKTSKIFLNKDQRAALEKFTKLSNDLVLQAGQGLGAKNFTDAKMRLLQMAKPVATNSAEANLFLIDKMQEEFEPWKEYKKDLLKGLATRTVVERDLDKYRSYSDMESEREPKNTQNRGITEEALMETASKYGITVEEVKTRLGM